MSGQRFERPSIASILVAAGAGATWGLTLARSLAESFAAPTFDLGPTVAVTGAAVLVSVGADAWLARAVPRDAKNSPWLALFLCAVYLIWPVVEPRVGWTLLGGSLTLAALLAVEPRSGIRDAIWMIVLAGVTFGLDLRTLGPTVGQADTFEFQVVAPTLGVAHPTGYPLYILSGKLFSWLPVGSVAWRVNLTSAVFGTVAVLLTFRLVRRVAPSSDRPLPAFLAALALAVSRVFWSQTVVAEVYALHNLFVALIIGLWLRLLDRRQDDARASLYALFLALGLSFANHLTTALLLPAVGLALLIARPRAALKDWLVAGGLFALGLSLYLYIYFRWPMLHDGVWMSPAAFWRYVTGQQFGGALRLDAWRTDPTRYAIVGRLLREPFGWPGLALGGVGLVWLAVRRWRVALLTGVTFLAYAAYGLSYYVPDVSVFVLPAHLVLAVWMGAGVAALARHARGLRTAWLALCALLPLGLLWTNLPRVDQSDERAAYAWGDVVLDLPIARDAAILADSARIAPLYYLQRIEGRRPDLDLLVLADEATYRAELENRLAAGQTVYLARFLPGLEGRFYLRSLGPLTEVSTAPLATPPVDKTLDVRFGDVAAGQIEWIGLSGPAPGPDGGMGLTLFWRASAPVGDVYHVRLRLVDARGQVWWQERGAHAANNYYPTPAWRPGEVVADYHEIPPLHADPLTAPDRFTVEVGLFRPFSDEGLTAQSGGRWVALTEVAPVFDRETALTRRLHARWDRTLLGVTVADEVPVGSSVDVALFWDKQDAGVSARLALDWVDAAGNRTPAPIEETWGRARLRIRAPDAPGLYTLRLSVVDGAGQRIAARCGWLARPTDDCALDRVRVTQAATTALANFDGQMLLTDAEVGLTALQPGQSLPVTLRWQALQPIEQDYTVSVQLVGPDGRLYGQVDAWPVQGTLPTRQWSPGREIVDPYNVALSPDAPPGSYRVGVVVYLLATQSRLALLDASGAAVGDMAWIAQVAVNSGR